MDTPKTTKRVGGINRAGLGFLLSDWLKAGKRRAFLLCETEEEAERLHQDLDFFSRFRTQAWKNLSLHFLPAWETSPYRLFQPSIAVRHDRLRALVKIASPDPADEWVVVASLESFLQVTAAKALFRESLKLAVGDVIHPETLAATLRSLGYEKADSVEDPGTFSPRGGILDVFSLGSDAPLRLEFLDDAIESIRAFNPESQRSIRAYSPGMAVRIPPARECLCSEASSAAARERLKEWCDRRDLPKSSRERIGTLLAQGIVTSEMDYLLPFFQDAPGRLTDLLPDGVDLFVMEAEQVRARYGKLREEWEKLAADSLSRQQVVPDPSLLYGDLDRALGAAAWGSVTQVGALAFGDEKPRFQRVVLPQIRGKAEVQELLKLAASAAESGRHLVLVANAQAQIDRLEFLFAQHRIRALAIHSFEDLPAAHPLVALAQGTISESFTLPESKLTFVSEDEVFGEKKHSASPRRKAQRPAIVMDDLGAGDLVVHSEHGIGRYQGLTKMRALDSEGDYVLLEYADGDKLYLPVYRLETLSKYVSAPDGGTAALDKLGSGSFSKTKERVKAAVREIAQDLLRVQAERDAKPGIQYSLPDDQFRAFESEFPFDETPDQAKAIDDTIADMCLGRPMDRLVCGDVGFGKTEVAIRAAYKAVQDGKQVAVLVPTTILAEQHQQTFSLRLQNHPVRIASISRFRSKKEQEAILADLKSGKLDVIIGTHRLLSKDVSFHDLGLIVVDEEQRFGVEHKERLKQIKATTDVLTLTATPIPRTLQMSLMGLKDVSIIRTAPGDRLSIKTYLSPFDEDVIRNAVRNELTRGGQVFFIHNRVQDIGSIAELMEKLVPEAKCVVAHGQMPEGALEKAMLGFYQKKYDVLIATAIIENGLDVPNANTLIVNRADTFGLSQLYQIRGRVGRSRTRAYAYFLIPEGTPITEDARERLSVLQRLVELGSGYAIATHDLEIRGGGDVLGQAQSGHIASVGYEMYVDLLQQEIRRVKGEKAVERLEEVEINIPGSAFLPTDYVPDTKSRLGLYRRLSSIATDEEAEEAKADLEDRFGPLPKEAEELFWVLRLKVLMRRMGLRSLTQGPKGISILPGQNPLLEPAMVLHIVQSHPERYAILPEGRFVIRGAYGTVSQTYDVVRKLLTSMTQ